MVRRQEAGGLNEMSEVDELARDVWVHIPYKRHLELGQSLIFDFVALRFPESYGGVEMTFRRRGSYRRYRSFLARRGAINDRCDFENAATERALRRWCEDEGIELEN